MSAPDTPVRDASTVVLLRDGADGGGLEAWMLTRVTQMAFAAGMSVFPGGRVDEADAALPMPADAVAEMATRWQTDDASARALVGAAVRETFEETGVLLTRPRADLSGARVDVEAGRVSFGDLLAANGLSVDVESLRPWARWVTPPNESRRYDTRFFLGALPDGAEAQDVTTESSHAGWVPLRELLEQLQRGERMMLPPTIVTVASLLEFDTVHEAFAASAARTLDTVQPTIRVEEDMIVAELPTGESIAMPKSMFR